MAHPGSGPYSLLDHPRHGFDRNGRNSCWCAYGVQPHQVAKWGSNGLEWTILDPSKGVKRGPKGVPNGGRILEAVRGPTGPKWPSARSHLWTGPGQRAPKVPKSAQKGVKMGSRRGSPPTDGVLFGYCSVLMVPNGETTSTRYISTHDL